MSRFADKLRDALQVTPPAMGFFRNAASASKPRMLLVTQMTTEYAEATPDIKAADAVLLVCTKALSAKTLKSLVKAAGNAPLGVCFTGKVPHKTVEGVDFLVFGAESALLAGEDIAGGAKVLMVPLDLSDGLARSLGDLPMESVLVDAGVAGGPTWMDLMCLHRLSDLITKPLLLRVPVTVSEKEIVMLWDAGVDALVVSVTSENQTAFKELCAKINGLTLSLKRKWMKARAIVPAIKLDETAAAYDDGDDDDDE